jgi:putative redox protein
MTMTLLLYARRKEWPLEGVEVDIEHDRIHADDAVNVEKPGGLVERFKINLVLRGDLNEVQVERLRDISTRCPMRKTLAATHVFEESVRLSE